MDHIAEKVIKYLPKTVYVILCYWNEYYDSVCHTETNDGWIYVGTFTTLEKANLAIEEEKKKYHRGNTTYHIFQSQLNSVINQDYYRYSGKY